MLVSGGTSLRSMRHFFYKAIVFNPEEYRMVMRVKEEKVINDEVGDGTKTKKRREEYAGLFSSLEKKNWEMNWLNERCDNYDFRSFLLDEATEISKNEDGKVTTDMVYREKKPSILELFEFIDDHYVDFFDINDRKTWGSFKMCAARKTREFWAKNMFKNLVSGFFKLLEVGIKKDRDPNFFELKEERILELVKMCARKNRVTFVSSVFFNLSHVVSFLLANIQKRFEEKKNFYYTDVFVFSKIVKLSSKLDDCHHQLFMLWSLSGLYEQIRHLFGKEVSLFLGSSGNGPPMGSVRGWIINHTSRMTKFDVVHPNHFFFVLGCKKENVIIDWNLMSVVHVERTDPKSQKVYSLKIIGDSAPVTLSKDVLCVLLAELYRFNCVIRFRVPGARQSGFRADQFEFVEYMLKVLKNPFSKKMSEDGLNVLKIPISPVDQVKKELSRNGDEWKPKSANLRNKLLKCLNSDHEVLDELRVEHVMVEDELLKPLKEESLRFWFPDRIRLDTFLKRFFKIKDENSDEHDQSLIDLNEFVRDRKYLIAVDRAFVLAEKKFVRFGKHSGRAKEKKRGSLFESSSCNTMSIRPCGQSQTIGETLGGDSFAVPDLQTYSWFFGDHVKFLLQPFVEKIRSCSLQKRKVKERTTGSNTGMFLLPFSRNDSKKKKGKGSWKEGTTENGPKGNRQVQKTGKTKDEVQDDGNKGVLEEIVIEELRV